MEAEEFRGIRKLSIDFKGENFAICGRNGTGKSGIVDALEFGLTGNILRLSGKGTGDISLKEHAPHVDSRNRPDKARVKLTVRIAKLRQASSDRTFDQRSARPYGDAEHSGGAPRVAASGPASRICFVATGADPVRDFYSRGPRARGPGSLATGRRGRSAGQLAEGRECKPKGYTPAQESEGPSARPAPPAYQIVAFANELDHPAWKMRYTYPRDITIEAPVQ